MAYVILILIVTFLFAVALKAPAATARQVPESIDRDDMSPAELAEADPVEALLRYGTPDDAARLAEQGVDLGDLGHRPRE